MLDVAVKLQISVRAQLLTIAAVAAAVLSNYESEPIVLIKDGQRFTNVPSIR